LNLYGFVGNNSVSRADVNGLATSIRDFENQLARVEKVLYETKCKFGSYLRIKIVIGEPFTNKYTYGISGVAQTTELNTDITGVPGSIPTITRKKLMALKWVGEKGAKGVGYAWAQASVQITAWCMHFECQCPMLSTKRYWNELYDRWHLDPTTLETARQSTPEDIELTGYGQITGDKYNIDIAVVNLNKALRAADRALWDIVLPRMEAVAEIANKDVPWPEESWPLNPYAD